MVCSFGVVTQPLVCIYPLCLKISLPVLPAFVGVQESCPVGSINEVTRYFPVCMFVPPDFLECFGLILARALLRAHCDRHLKELVLFSKYELALDVKLTTDR